MTNVIHVCGAPGSGKTVLSTALAESLGLPRIAVDDERRKLLRPFESWPRNDAATWNRMRHAIDRSDAIVVETMGGTTNSRVLLAGHRVFTIYCRVDEHTRKTRLKSKAANAGDPLIGRPDRYLASIMRVPVVRVPCDLTWNGTASMDGEEYHKLVAQVAAWR